MGLGNVVKAPGSDTVKSHRDDPFCNVGLQSDDKKYRSFAKISYENINVKF
jgi:hypothetical protein